MRPRTRDQAEVTSMRVGMGLSRNAIPTWAAWSTTHRGAGGRLRTAEPRRHAGTRPVIAIGLGEVRARGRLGGGQRDDRQRVEEGGGQGGVIEPGGDEQRCLDQPAGPGADAPGRQNGSRASRSARAASACPSSSRACKSSSAHAMSIRARLTNRSRAGQTITAAR